MAEPGERATDTDQQERLSWLPGSRRLVQVILPGPLRFRLAFPFVVLVAALMLVLTIALSSAARSVYEDQLTAQLEDQAYLISGSILANRAIAPETDVAVVIDELVANIDSRITIIALDGTVLADSETDPQFMDNHASRTEVAEAVTNGVGSTTRFSRTVDVDFLYVAVLTEGNDVVVRVAFPLDEVDEAVAVVRRTTLLATAIAVAMTVGIAWFIAGRIADPLEQLRAQAQEVARGDFSARVEPADSRELAEVAYAFNTMTTEIGRSRDALEQTRARLESVLAGLSDGVVLTDEDGLVLRLNTAAEHMLRVTETSAIGKPFVQVVRDHEIAHLLQVALRGDHGSSAAIEHGLNRRTLLTSANVIEGARERLGLVVLRDISELRRLETVRREFVANVSHELRTPLTSIRAMVETLETGAVEDEHVTRDFFVRIVEEVDRLTALVEDLLDLARLEAGRTAMRYASVDPAAILREGAERLRPQVERARLAMTVTAPDDLRSIMIDRPRVEQVLVNLIHNAIKFTPPDGTLHISVEQDNEWTTVEVKDSGVGIVLEEQARLFERFYKSDKARRTEGTGLGLAIAKHIVQSHGGAISVTSSPGEGSTFRFTLPNHQDERRHRARSGSRA